MELNSETLKNLSEKDLLIALKQNFTIEDTELATLIIKEIHSRKNLVDKELIEIQTRFLGKQ